MLTNGITRMRVLTPAHRSLRPAGIPAYCVLSSCHSIPKHPIQSNHRFNSQFSVIHDFQASPWIRRLATAWNRNGFVILQTDSSFPVTLHPTSRWRSYFQLQRFWLSLIRTFTVLIARPHGRTDPGSPCRNDETFVVSTLPRSINTKSKAKPQSKSKSKSKSKS